MSNEEKFPIIARLQSLLGPSVEGPITLEDHEYVASVIGRDPPENEDDHYLCSACEEADTILPGHFKCAF